VDAVELLIKNGAQLNARTGPAGKGGSALNIALDFHDATHPLPRYLLSNAENIEPEL
jgi:hypothetical protein